MNKLLKSKTGIAFLSIFVIILQYLIFIAVGYSLFFIFDYFDGFFSPLSLKHISKEINADVSGGEMIYGFDNHGGFHGDGHAYIEIKMPSSFEEELKDNSEWQSLPMLEEVRGLCDYNIDKCNGKDYERAIPHVKNGFYYYINRSPDITKSYIPNFTVAVYDSDSDIMYYWEYDS